MPLPFFFSRRLSLSEEREWKTKNKSKCNLLILWQLCARTMVWFQSWGTDCLSQTTGPNHQQNLQSTSHTYLFLTHILCSFGIMHFYLITFLRGTRLCVSREKEVPNLHYLILRIKYHLLKSKAAQRPMPEDLLVALSEIYIRPLKMFLWPRENNEQTAACLIDESTSQRLH